MSFPNMENYERGNILTVTHHMEKPLRFDTQAKCFSYITKNVSALIEFAKMSYKDTKNPEIAEFLCMPKEIEGLNT
tara:strand:+ start:622 stop:849 length:228 start_codon:yes stop_codon:yes gene_type:complete